MPKGHVRRGEQEKAFQIHRRKVMTMRATLDQSPPRRHRHLDLKLRDIRIREEYLANVDRENKILLHKMVRIMEKPRRSSEFWNDVKYKSLNEPYRNRVQREIEQQNLVIARRLEATMPVYKVEKWEEDYQRHLELKQMLQEDGYESQRDTSRGKSESRTDDQYEDDFESDDEDKDSKHSKDSKKSDKLPQIKQEKQQKEKEKKEKEDKDKDKESQRRGSQDNNAQKLPKIKEKKHDADLYMYWGRYFNNDPADDRNRDEDSRADAQAELEAKQLFRVAKGLEPPTDILIRTLIRRSPKQREATRQKFKELYDLCLAKELKTGLGKRWHVLIDALLPPEDKDEDEDKKTKDEDKDGKDKGGEGGPEEALNSALEKKDIPAAVKIICQHENHLSDLKEVYKKEYFKSVEDHASEVAEDPELLFLLTLLKDKNEDGKKGGGAHQEATDIYEQGDGRWSSPSGEFIQLLGARSNGHVRAVLKQYTKVSGGTSAVKDIEKDCSKNYARAVEAFLNAKGKRRGSADSGHGGGGSEENTAHAVKMYKNMHPENAEFVNLLVERAEIDMPSVRKAYSKKYKTELQEDLQERSRHPTVHCLVELIMKNPPKDSKDKDQGKKKGHDKGDQQAKGQGQDEGKGKGDGKKEDKKKKSKGDAKAEEDAEKLKKAMDGMGTDEDTILNIIIEKSNAQRQTLKKKYKEKYKKDLAEDLKSELSGDFEEVILGLLMPPVDYDAFCLNKAVKGLGTNEDVLIGIMCTANPKELTKVKEKYKKAYGEDLDSALKGDTSGGFADLLLALSQGERDQGTSVNEKEAKADAQKMFKGKKTKLDLEDETFKEVMTKKNKEQMKATFAEYKKLSGKSMDAAIKEAAKGDAEDGFVGLLSASDDPVTFYANSLQKAFKGFGTNDDQLIRIVVSRSEVDLPAIKAKFQELHGKSLRSAIESETSGDYRRALVKIVDKKKTSEEIEKEDEEKGEESKGEEERNDLGESNDDSRKTGHHQKVNDKSSRQQKPAPNKGDRGKDADRGINKSENAESNGPHKGGGLADTEHNAKKETGGKADAKANNSTTKTKAEEKSTKGSKSQKDSKDASQSKGKQNAGHKKGQDKNSEGQTRSEEASEAEDAEKLHKAMDGLGTDEDTILNIIIEKSNAQRQTLKKAYKEKYNKELAEDLKSELSGDFEEVILGLLIPPVDYDAFCLNKAVKGLGTNEDVLIGIMCTANSKDLPAIKEIYAKTYDEDLDSALKGDTSGGFADLLLALSQGEKDQGTSVDEKEAKAAAQKMFKGKKAKLDLNDATFKELMTKKNKEQMEATCAEYKKLSGKSMEDAIKDSASGDTRDGYVALLTATDDPVTFYANSLQKAFKGLGTNDDQLIRIVVSRSEVDLHAIKARFQELHQKPLSSAIESETSGDYRKALIKLVDKAEEPPAEAEEKDDKEDEDGDENEESSKTTHQKANTKSSRQPDQNASSQKPDHSREPAGRAVKSENPASSNAHKAPAKGNGKEHKATKKEATEKDAHGGTAKTKTEEKSAKAASSTASTQKKADAGKAAKDNSETSQHKKGKQNEQKKGHQQQEGQKDDKKKKPEKSQDEDDANKLHKAMDGMGTDEDTILNIIIEKSNAQRQTLKKAYKEKYKKELAEDLKSELSGDFEEVILGLLMPPVDYDAFCLNKAVKGLGTNEDVLIGIMCTANPKELTAVKETYKTTYDEDLDSALKGDTSGGFADLLLALSQGERDQGTSVNEKEAKADAQKMFKTKKAKLDLNDDTFTELMTKKNKEQMQATFAEYKKLSGKTMEDAIKASAAKDDVKDCYLGLLSATDDPVTFYANSLQKAFKGMGTNDDQLIRIIVSRSEVDLPAIKAKFQELHQKPLRSAIESESSGDYRRALLKIVDKKITPKDEKGEEEENAEGGKMKEHEEEDKERAEGTPEKVTNGSPGSSGSRDNGEFSRENNPNSTTNEKIPDLAKAQGNNSQHAIADSSGNKESNSREKARYRKPESKRESESESKSAASLPQQHNRKPVLKADESSKGEDRSRGKSEDTVSNERKALVTTDGKSNKFAAGGREKIKPTKGKDSSSTATDNNKTESKIPQNDIKKDKADQNKKKKTEVINSQKESDDTVTKDSRNGTAMPQKGSRENTAKAAGSHSEKKNLARPDNAQLDDTTVTKDSRNGTAMSQKGSRENTGKAVGSHSEKKISGEARPDNAQTDDTTKSNDLNREGSSNDDIEQQKGKEEEEEEKKQFDPAGDAEILHDAMKGFGTDEKAIISVIAARDLSQRLLIRQTYKEKYSKDLLPELRSELSGNLRELVLDLLRSPWEREVDALVSSMAGVGTDETLMVHVLLTHRALSAVELSERFKEAEKKELLKAVESETSGQLRRFLQCLLKVKMKKQKPDSRSPEDVAKKLHNGGKPLLQSKPLDSIDLLARFPPDKMASMTTHYQQMSGRYLQDDIHRYLSAASSALLAYVNHSLNPQENEIDMLNRSLEGDVAFRIFSLIVCNKEAELLDLQTRFTAVTGKTLQSAVEKDLHGDARTLMLRVLERAPGQQ